MKFKINDYVYTMNKNDGAIDIEQKLVKAIKETCLGVTYHCLGIDDEIEVCFEKHLYTLDELIKMDHLNA